MAKKVLTKEQVEHLPELKNMPGNLDYCRESPTVQSYIDESRKKEWKKYEEFQAAIPLKGKELSDLLEAGHVPIPSKWVHTVKNIHENIDPTMCLSSSRGWCLAATSRTHKVYGPTRRHLTVRQAR